MSTLTLQQALDQLRVQSGQYNSKQALYDLAKQVNVNAVGDVTILYSGQTTLEFNGKPLVSAQQILDGMKRNSESIRIIDDTDAAKFLGSKAFKDALASQYGLSPRDIDPLTNPTDLSPTKQAALKLMNDALYHPTAGPWAQASGRFVEATVGEVRTLTGGAGADRVFGQTEVPAALKNPTITTIDGILRSELDAKGEAEAFKAISAQSEAYSAGLRVATDANGNILLDADGQPRFDSRSQTPDLPRRYNAAQRASTCISKTTAANQPYWLQAA